MHFTTLLRRTASLFACAALLVGAGTAAAIQTEDFDDEVVGELIGELVFSADLLSSLDRLCPRGGPAQDWHGALPALPPEATTPELLELSRQLAADAGRQMLRDNGGCAAPAFVAAYAESKQSFGELIERWRRL
jgi:hypothetical protein